MGGYTLLNYLFSQLTRSLGVFFRTIRAFFSRKLVSITARLRRLTSFSRNAMKVATGSLQAAATAMKKPTKRDDYVETERLFISKAFLIKLLLVLAALGLIFYFLVWPFILSHFMTVKFYVEDSRVAEWTGQVIVYADKDKTLPLYAGRLENGVLQGVGEEYDENGLISYEGPFLDGQRSGEGVAYEDGVLAYEGQFSGGLYEGRGRLYDDGILSYEGSFEAGKASGDGTAYHQNGQVSYRGQFAEGLREGTGTAYREDGVLLYEGSFSLDLYNGSGRLYLSEDQWIDGEFQSGTAAGTVQWFKTGQLYYEGEWGDDRPEGYGTLYNQGEQAVYQGQFTCGTLDGSWLLDLTPEDLRTVLGEGAQTAENAAGGYLISSAQLGLTALCSYQTAEADSQIYAIYLTAPSQGAWIALLPGDDRITMETDSDGVEREGVVAFSPLQGMSLTAGVYEAQMVTVAAHTTTCLYSGDAAVLLSWSRLGAAPEVLNTEDMTDAETAGNTDRMEEFLASVNLGESAAAASGAAAENPYYGGEDPATALAGCTDVNQAATLLDAMLSYWEQSERQAALEENLTRVNEQLSDAQAQLAMGNGSQATVDDLESQRNALESAIQSCQAQRSLAKLQGQSVGVESVSAYNLGDTLILFDPADADASQLSLAATAWAQATGGDESQAELKMMTALVNLTEAYSNVQTALRSYETAAAAVQSAAGTYATGSGTKTAWYAALSAQADARMALCSALASFARGANQFNTLTGGWVSRSQDWFNETLEPMFQAVIQAAPEEEPEQGQEETTAEDPTNPEDPAAGGTETPEEEPAAGEPTDSQPEDSQTEPDQANDQTAADAAA